jgi:hypothetical protein
LGCFFGLVDTIRNADAAIGAAGDKDAGWQRGFDGVYAIQMADVVLRVAALPSVNAIE